MLSRNDERSSSPLHEAVKGGFEDVVRVLLRSDAAVLPKDDRGWSPLDHAMASDRREIYVLLCDAMFQQEAKVCLFGCFRGDHLSRLLGRDVADCIAQCYGVCVGGEHGSSADRMGRALLRSVKTRNFNAVVFLLAHGADPDYLDDDKIPALHQVIRSSAGGDD